MRSQVQGLDYVSCVYGEEPNSDDIFLVFSNGWALTRLAPIYGIMSCGNDNRDTSKTSVTDLSGKHSTIVIYDSRVIVIDHAPGLFLFFFNLF